MPRYRRNLLFNRNVLLRFVLCIAISMALVHIVCFAEEAVPSEKKFPPPVLKKAVLCEKVINRVKPINEGVVFSSSLGWLICFTEFDPVYEETFIYHKFYFKDKFFNKFRLKIKPPSYATQSGIQLIESYKGPWRVEITDAEGNILSTKRFSITD